MVMMKIEKTMLIGKKYDFVVNVMHYQNNAIIYRID